MHWHPRQFDEYLYVLGSKVCTCLHSQDAFSRRERKEEMYPTLVNLLTLVWVTCQSNFHIFFRVGFWYALPLSLREHREGAVDTQQGRVASWRQQGRQEDWLCGNLRTFREDKVRVLPLGQTNPCHTTAGWGVVQKRSMGTSWWLWSSPLSSGLVTPQYILMLPDWCPPEHGTGGHDKMQQVHCRVPVWLGLCDPELDN